MTLPTLSRPVSLLLAAWLMVIALASAASAAALDTNQRQIIDKISGYFNSLRTLKGEFTQISPRGRVSTGVFFISKPGKLRFEYAPPNPFLIVSDGTWLTVQNRARERMDQYPLSATPLNLVLSEKVDLAKEANIRSIDRDGDIARVALEDRDKMVPGHLVLSFNTANNTLIQWEVIDGQGRKTTIALSNIVAGVFADPALFRVVKPRNSEPKTDR